MPVCKCMWDGLGISFVRKSLCDMFPTRYSKDCSLSNLLIYVFWILLWTWSNFHRNLKVYICCKKNAQIAYSNSFSNEVQVRSSNHRYWTIPTIHAPILSCNACMWATSPLPRSRAMGKRKAWQARLERVDEEDGEAGNFYKSWSSLEIHLDQ
jgi:hypothetical protein